jgi:hypothetical protein
MAYFGPSTEDFDDIVILSDEGHVHYVGKHPPITEKIPGAGLFSEDATGWGYMSGIRQIGDHLYACGGAGQVYKRVGPDQWLHMDDGLLQPTDVDERLLPRDINGPNEQEIYLAGALSSVGYPGQLHFWNGESWRKLALPTDERLNAIYVEDENRIWICGSNGTLLFGNHRDGFIDVSAVEDNQLFTSLTKVNERIYLASNLGLFVYDGAGIHPVQTGLNPQLQDANVVDAIDGVLWSIGPKDIAKFDGKQWTRIDHPDNPPIR